MITLEKLRAVRENPGEDSPLTAIGIRTNATLIAPLENALRTVLAANGVDMDTAVQDRMLHFHRRSPFHGMDVPSISYIIP